MYTDMTNGLEEATGRRKTAIIEKEMEMTGIYIATLSETRLAATGSMFEMRYTFWDRKSK